MVPDDQWNNFLKDRNGAIVGAATMKRFGWKIGDRIPIKTTLYGLAGSSHGSSISMVYITAKDRKDDETQFWFQWDTSKSASRRG